jgi:hypothetical protein
MRAELTTMGAADARQSHAFLDNGSADAGAKPGSQLRFVHDA